MIEGKRQSDIVRTKAIHKRKAAHNAANEQAEGAAQISKAVVEMEKVVQHNAANTEQTASSIAMFKLPDGRKYKEYLSQHRPAGPV